MIIAWLISLREIIVVVAIMVAFIFPVVLRKIRSRRDNMTEKLDQLERLERMFRDGSLSEREFKRQKRKIMKNKK